MARIATCRSCGSDRLTTFLDLGQQPIANALVEPERLGEPEERFPLEVAHCADCALVQVTESLPPEVLFGRDYPYFSSFSPALLKHSRDHALALMAERALGPDSLVIEVASNDGYLLKNFAAEGVPVLGVDPATGPAEAARASGIETLNTFFDETLAQRLVGQGRQADVILANNVAAHVDDINGFVAGFAPLLKRDGIVEIEVAYLLDLVEGCAFDTIYHEHVFYHSLTALEPLFLRHGLRMNDVERLDIHGGSIRVRFSHHAGKTDRLCALLAEEDRLGMANLGFYADFATRVEAVGHALRTLVGRLRGEGARIAAYGAAAKGATLLNYAGLTDMELAYVVDRNTHKVGKYMPGTGLEIRPVEALRDDRPDYLLLLAWNFGREIMRQNQDFAQAGGRFILPVPEPRIVGAPEEVRGAKIGTVAA